MKKKHFFILKSLHFIWEFLAKSYKLKKKKFILKIINLPFGKKWVLYLNIIVIFGMILKNIE